MTALDQSITITYPEPIGPVPFTGLLFVQGLGGAPFGQQGDSGSVIVVTPGAGANTLAVGLLVGTTATTTAATPMGPVLDALRVSF